MMMNRIDTLELLSGKTIRITDKIAFVQPRLQKVADIGEQKYYNILSNLTAIPSDMKSVLWDANIDWMELSDLELFYMLSGQIPREQTEIFFPNIDFSKFMLVQQENGDKVMYSKDDDIKIDFFVYMKMQECLCKSHGLKKKVERAGNKYTKQILIEEDRQNRKIRSEKEFESSLFGMISALVNYPGFKYNYSTIWELTMFQFMNAVQRCRLIETTNHLLNGIYAGTIDSKKIKNEKLDWMREVRDD